MHRYTPTQTAAARRLHDADREYLDLQHEEPAHASDPDYEQRYAEFTGVLDAAFHAVSSAEDCYRAAFPDPATRPEAHEVLAAQRGVRLQLGKILALTGMHLLGQIRATAREAGRNPNLFAEYTALHDAAKAAGATGAEITEAWVTPGYGLPWHPPTL